MGFLELSFAPCPSLASKRDPRLENVMRQMALIFAAVLAFSTLGIAQAYQQANLVSDTQGLAQTHRAASPMRISSILGDLFQVPQVRGGYPTTTPAFRPSTTDRE